MPLLTRPHLPSTASNQRGVLSESMKAVLIQATTTAAQSHEKSDIQIHKVKKGLLGKEAQIQRIENYHKQSQKILCQTLYK